MQRTMGVYAVRNLNTGKAYVGSSTWVEQRLDQHRCMMKDGCHPNPRLRGAAEYTRLDRFEFVILERVADEAQLAARELAWIKQLNAVNNGYNRTYRTEHFPRGDSSYFPSQERDGSLVVFLGVILAMIIAMAIV